VCPPLCDGECPSTWANIVGSRANPENGQYLGFAAVAAHLDAVVREESRMLWTSLVQLKADCSEQSPRTALERMCEQIPRTILSDHLEVGSDQARLVVASAWPSPRIHWLRVLPREGRSVPLMRRAAERLSTDWAAAFIDPERRRIFVAIPDPVMGRHLIEIGPRLVCLRMEAGAYD